MNEAGKYRQVVGILVPVILSLALSGVSIYAAMMQQRAEKRVAALEARNEIAYRQAYYQLSDNVNDMQTALRKLSVAGSPARHVLLLADVWRLSGAASASLGSVPQSHADTSALAAFIARTGDYAHVLAQRILGGGVITSADYETLDTLYEASVRVGNDLKKALDEDAVPVRALSTEDYFGGAAPEASGTESGDGEAPQPDTAGEAPASEAGQQSEEAIADYPTLIYDGPFSESNETAAPRGLPAGQVDEAAALQAAINYLGGGQLAPTGLVAGTIPVFGFSGKDAGGRDVEITVSQAGGAVLWMMASVAAGADGVPDEATVSRMRDEAKSYLDRRGYAGMEATYAQFYDGVGVFNFAATQGNVILYGDLVKVYVERATGAVCGVDANNYLMFHTPRTLPAVQLTQAEAAERVSERLTVKSIRLALIPKTASTEALCYEFKGVQGETSFIVYVNAVTGAEEEIFEIIDSEDGQLVV